MKLTVCIKIYEIIDKNSFSFLKNKCINKTLMSYAHYYYFSLVYYYVFIYGVYNKYNKI